MLLPATAHFFAGTARIWVRQKLPNSLRPRASTATISASCPSTRPSSSSPLSGLSTSSSQSTWTTSCPTRTALAGRSSTRSCPTTGRLPAGATSGHTLNLPSKPYLDNIVPNKNGTRRPFSTRSYPTTGRLPAGATSGHTLNLPSKPYLDSIVPNENNTRRPFFYAFLHNYWAPSRRRNFRLKIHPRPYPAAVPQAGTVMLHPKASSIQTAPSDLIG